MSRYPIAKDFKKTDRPMPYHRLLFPLAGPVQKLMMRCVPPLEGLTVSKESIPGFQGKPVPVELYRPVGKSGKLPCVLLSTGVALGTAPPLTTSGWPRGGGHGRDAGKVMGHFRRPFPFQNLPPLRSAKGSILNPSSVGSTRRAQNLSMYQGVKQLCPGVGAGAGRRRSACQRHRPGSHPQPYTTDERCPWKALGSSKCGTWRSASALGPGGHQSGISRF